MLPLLAWIKQLLIMPLPEGRSQTKLVEYSVGFWDDSAVKVGSHAVVIP